MCGYYILYTSTTRTADELEGFSRNLKKLKKRSLCARKEKIQRNQQQPSSGRKNKLSTSERQTNNNTTREQKKLESKSDAVSTRPHSHFINI